MKINNLLLGMVISLSASISLGAEYEVTITNLTKGQPITPVALVIHKNRGSYSLFSLGNEASEGLKVLSQSGSPQLLLSEAELNRSVQSTEAVAGITPPGATSSTEIKGKTSDYLSIAAMLARTNDAFLGRKNVSLKMRKGHSKLILVKVYDAGAEENNEAGEYIPAIAPLNSNINDSAGSEGFVHPHPGVYGISDLDPLIHVFASQVAKVTIKRIK